MAPDGDEAVSHCIPMLSDGLQLTTFPRRTIWEHEQSGAWYNDKDG
jgi:hypothetical protein